LRVAIETQYALGTPTGLGVYAASLAAALRRRGDVDVIELYDGRFDVWRFDRRLYWDQIRAPLLARAAHADVVHFTGGTLPVWAPHPVVLTLHDLAWLHRPSRAHFYARWYFGGLQARAARAADVLVADTNAARQEICARLHLKEKNVRVVAAGVDPAFFSLTRSTEDPPFILYVGTIEERKDAVTAVAAIARLSGVHLVCAGPRLGGGRQWEPTPELSTAG